METEIRLGASYHLRIVFECLIAWLVREHDVVAVLPDGREGCPPMRMPPGNTAGAGPGTNGNAATGHHAHHHHNHDGTGPALPAHVAAIQFDPAHLSGSSEVEPDFLYCPRGARADQAFVLLTGEDIALKPAPEGTPRLVRGRRKGLQAPESAVELAAFDWVVDLRALAGPAGRMHPDCIRPGSNGSRPGEGGRVVARMPLTGGMLSTIHVAKDRNHQAIPFDFIDPGDSGHVRKRGTQALACAVAYDIVLPHPEVALELTKFGTQTPRRLEFSFAGLPMGYAIQVLIKNMPLDSLLELPNTLQRNRPAPDDHFLMYYALSRQSPKIPWIPFSNRTRALNPVCPKAQFTE